MFGSNSKATFDLAYEEMMYWVLSKNRHGSLGNQKNVFTRFVTMQISYILHHFPVFSSVVFKYFCVFVCLFLNEIKW